MAIFDYVNPEDDFANFSSQQNEPTFKHEIFELMYKDFLAMKKSKELEKKYFKVFQINIINRAENLKLKKEDFENFLPLNKNASFILLTEFFPFPKKEASFLVQFSWYHRKTKNKVWEINRVYDLTRQGQFPEEKDQISEKKLGKKKPDQKN